MLVFDTLAQGVPLVFTLGTLGVVGVWFARLPALAITGLIASLVVGQAIRLPLPGQGGGILVSDIALVLVLMSAVVGFVRDKKRPKIPNPKHQISNNYQNPKSQAPNSNYRLRVIRHFGGPAVLAGQLLLFFLPFILWSLFTLVIHVPALGLSASFIAGAYWLRLSLHLLLFPALVYLVRQPTYARWVHTGVVIGLLCLVLLGFTQLLLVPRLAILGSGWDPHEERLVSTWLDPNFFGGLLVMTLPWLMSESIVARQRWWKIGSLITLWATLVALLLTRSRSSFVALLIGCVVVSPLWWFGYRQRSIQAVVRLLVYGGLVIGIAVLGIGILKQRAAGLVTYDPTVQLRIHSLQEAWHLAQEQSLAGVGYNAYQFAAQQAGLITEFSIHSRAGADTSLLTLWVTTGIAGVVLFALPWAAMVSWLALNWVRTRDAPSLALLLSVVVWWIHSLFVNSLLYAHLLIMIALLLATGVARPSRA